MGLYFFLSLTVLTFSSISSAEGAISSTSASSQRSPTMSCIAWSLIDKPVSSSNISCALLYGSSVATLAPAFFSTCLTALRCRIRSGHRREGGNLFAVHTVEIGASQRYFSYHRFHSPLVYISPIKHYPAVWAHHRFSI